MGGEREKQRATKQNAGSHPGIFEKEKEQRLQVSMKKEPTGNGTKKTKQS